MKSYARSSENVFVDCVYSRSVTGKGEIKLFVRQTQRASDIAERD